MLSVRARFSSLFADLKFNVASRLLEFLFSIRVRAVFNYLFLKKINIDFVCVCVKICQG